MDIVTEVAPADAQKVLDSEHARLLVCDANRVLVGIFNRYPESGVPLDDPCVRQAINLAVDFERVIKDGLKGYANPIPALTPSWCGGFPQGAEPYPHDGARARALLDEAGWPKGRALKIATPAPFEGVARMVAKDIGSALGIQTRVMVIPDADMGVGARVLIEKKLSSRLGYAHPRLVRSQLGSTAGGGPPRVLRRRRRIPGRTRRPRVRPAVRGYGAATRSRRAGGRGGGDRSLCPRPGAGAVSMRAAGAVRGQQARRFRAVSNHVRAGRDRSQ